VKAPNVDCCTRFNVLGQVAVTTGITFGCAALISTTATVNSGYTPSAGKTIGIYAALLIPHASVNGFGVSFPIYLNSTSIILSSVDINYFTIAILAKVQSINLPKPPLLLLRCHG